MDNNHNIKDLDLLYLDAKKLVDDIALDGIDENILAIFDKIVDDLVEQWRGYDAVVQINKLIEARNLLIDNRDIVGNIGVFISTLAKNYRDAQNVNGVILPSFIQLTISKVDKIEKINNGSQEVYVNGNIRNTITNLNNIVSPLDELNGLVNKISVSIFDNWIQDDENRNYAIKMFKKYSENSVKITNIINEFIKCINKSIDNYNASKNAINSMPSLESMFASSQITEKQYSPEEKKMLNHIDKNIDNYKKINDKFNDVLVNEVKKELVNKGIIE